MVPQLRVIYDFIILPLYLTSRAPSPPIIIYIRKNYLTTSVVPLVINLLNYFYSEVLVIFYMVYIFYTEDPYDYV